MSSNYKNLLRKQSNENQTYTNATFVGDTLLPLGDGKTFTVTLGTGGTFLVESSSAGNIITCDETVVTRMQGVYESDAIVAQRIAGNSLYLTPEQIDTLSLYGTCEAGEVHGVSLSTGLQILCYFPLPSAPATAQGLKTACTILVGAGQNLTSVAAYVDVGTQVATIVGDIQGFDTETVFHYIIHAY